MIRFGFIGCGSISRFHADVVCALGHGIVGVAARPGSKNLKDFASQYQVENSYEDWRQMLKEQKPEALVVAVSWDETEKIITDIIQVGIPCLIEKPVALSTKKLDEIISKVGDFAHQVMVGYNRRFYDFVPVVQQALKDKELLSIELNLPENLNRLIKTKSKAVAEHILVYQSSHGLDLLTFLIGPLQVAWMEKKMNPSLGIVQAYNGILKAADFDVPVHLQANFDTPNNTSLVFHFIDSVFRLCPMEELTVYQGMDVIEPNPQSPLRRYIPKVTNVFSVDCQYKPGFMAQMRNFIDVCVLKKDALRIGGTLPESLTVIELCEKIKDCSR